MKFLTALFFVVVVITSCETQVDINGPWRETPVVMALIDYSLDTQIFRIQKTYQNEAGQKREDIAQIPDSLYIKNLAVKIINNNDTSKHYSFSRTFPMKDPGFFSNKDSSYWAAYIPKSFFSVYHSYTLLLTNTETGKTYTSVSNLVDTARINRPPNYTPHIIDLTTFTTPTFSLSVESTGFNSYIIDKYFRLKYVEYPLNNPADSTIKYVDFTTYSALKNTTSNAGIPVNSRIDKKGYLDYLTTKISKNNQVFRAFRAVEIVISAANKDFSDMLLTNTPSTSVVPKGTQYTNITNGIGIFASRTNTSKAQIFTPATISYINQSILNR